MDKIKELIISFLNNENYSSFAGMIITAYSSYLIAKFTAYWPNRLKVKQMQLDFVYLPLYRLFDNLPSTIDKKQALDMYEKINSILDKHYELAFPQLHSFNSQLKESILTGNDYNEILHSIFHQVSVEYELLKKSLGYPSENSINIFIRMTKKQKCESIMAIINVLWITSPIYAGIFAFLTSSVDSLTASLGAFIFLALPVLGLNHLVSKMKD